MRRLRFVVLMLVFTPVFVGIGNLSYAAPSITSVSGSVAHNGTVTIGGSGFGSKTAAAPVLWDTVDNQATYSGLSDGATIPTGGGNPWPNNHNGTVKYDRSSVQRHGNSTAAYTANAVNGLFVEKNIPTSHYMYISWWWKPASSPMGSADHSSKFFRASNSRDVVNKTFSWNQQSDYVYSSPNYCQNGGGINWAGWSGNTGQWNFMEAWFDSVNRRYETTVNGVSNGVINWNLCSAFDFDQVNAIGWDSGGSNPFALRFWMDDIYVDNALSRVMICSGSTWGNRSHCEMQIPSSWGQSSITARVNQGTFGSGSGAYIYVVDTAGTANSNGYRVTFGSSGGTTPPPPPPPPTDTLPSVNITSPTSQSTYTTSQSSITLSGSTTDDKGITSVSWSNNAGGNGTATNSSGNWSTWTISNVPLQSGSNVIIVTARDTIGQTTSDTVTVNYSTSGSTSPVAWSATSQTGDSNWKDSTVTYCVRLLVQGNRITQSGDIIRLGFQGRNSGSYSIRGVSIAEKDPNVTGNVVNGTWTRVTFDGRPLSSWSTDPVSVAAGSEKLSDKIPFTVQAGKDYYVTFKIDTPAVYLLPPSTYQELYFYTEDRAGDVNWSGKGYSVTQDYHALSNIYVTPGPAVRPRAPQGITVTNVSN